MNAFQAGFLAAALIMMMGCVVGCAIYHNLKRPEAPKEVSICMTPAEVEKAVYEQRDKIIERELHLVIVGDGYHPALKPPPKKPEIFNKDKDKVK